MNQQIIDDVVARLETAQYSRLKSPLLVAGVAFDLGEVLLGPPGTLDLVIVAAYGAGSLSRQVQSLAQALDMQSSRLSLTAVLCGDNSLRLVEEPISSVSRVLLVLEGSSDAELDDQLAALLPIALPTPSSAQTDPFGIAWAALTKAERSSLEGSPLLDPALREPSSARNAYVDWIVEALREDWIGE